LGQGLVFVGKAGSGINERLRKRLNALLRQRLCKRPLVPCKSRGLWVEPGLYCEVSYLELTDGGEMRFPVFHRLIEE
jgi:ATP-dependent DNA ligase